MRRYFFVLSFASVFLIFFLLFSPDNVFAQNLLVNSDFESGNLEPWISSGGGAAAVVSTESALNGGYSLKVQNSKVFSYGFQQTIKDLEGGMFYEVGGFGMSNDSQTDSYFLRVAWYESSDGSGSQMSSPVDTQKITAKDGKWYKFSMVVQAPASARSAKVRLIVTSSSDGFLATAYFDDIYFIESVSPPVSSTPTPTQSSTSSQNTSTVKISQPKDQNGVDILGSLKIYIDGNYTGNYAPETYTFGDGKSCGSNNVPCGFGTHTFKVEKTGYLPWVKTADITVGSNYEFDPVLILASPSPTPTIKLSPTASASATPKSTPVDISTSTSSALLAEDVFSNKSVLGAESMEKTPPPEENIPADPKLKAAALFFITAGISFLGSAVYAYIRSKNRKVKNEEKSDEAEEESEENH